MSCMELKEYQILDFFSLAISSKYFSLSVIIICTKGQCIYFHSGRLNSF